MTSLIVNYIPQEMSNTHLLSIFSTVGSVESCKIMRDHQTGYSHGYGFVTYATPEDAQKAILQLNGYQVGNKRIKVSYSRPSGDEIKNTNLYITNLPRHYTVDDLENIFGKFGRIVQKNLLKDKVTGISRGVAFVRFDKRDEADRAIAEMDGKMLGDRGGALSVKVAEEHGKQKAAFYIGWQAGLRHCVAPFPPDDIVENGINVPKMETPVYLDAPSTTATPRATTPSATTHEVGEHSRKKTNKKVVTFAQEFHKKRMEYLKLEHELKMQVLEEERSYWQIMKRNSLQASLSVSGSMDNSVEKTYQLFSEDLN